MDSFLKTDYVPQVGYQVADPTRMGEMIAAIVAVMRKQHGIDAGRQNDFYVIQPSDMQKRLVSSFATMKLFVVLICASGLCDFGARRAGSDAGERAPAHV